MQLGVGGILHRRGGRVLSRCHPLLKSLEHAVLKVPLGQYEALLIGLVEGKPLNYFRVIPNDDNMYQVEVGCPSFAQPKRDYHDEEALLLSHALASVRKAIKSYPIPEDHRAALLLVIDDWASKNFPSE